MKKTYWSCTKFADFVRGTPKPTAETSEGWKEWEIKAKTAHYYRFLLAEEGLDKLQDIILYPYTVYRSIRAYIRNRYIEKNHQLTAHPHHIKPGEYCDLPERVLYCLFDSLVDFVEIELAYMNDFKNTGRSVEKGLAHLDWATTLMYDDTWGIDENDEKYGHPTQQALAAQEIKELYLWWTTIYPIRRDPLDVYEETNSIEKSTELEMEYEKEDTEMLIRLIKVRGHLWT